MPFSKRTLTPAASSPSADFKSSRNAATNSPTVKVGVNNARAGGGEPGRSRPNAVTKSRVVRESKPRSRTNACVGFTDDADQAVTSAIAAATRRNPSASVAVCAYSSSSFTAGSASPAAFRLFSSINQKRRSTNFEGASVTRSPRVGTRPPASVDTSSPR